MIYFKYSLSKDFPNWSGINVYDDSILDKCEYLDDCIEKIIEYIECENNDEVLKWELSDSNSKGVKQ